MKMFVFNRYPMSYIIIICLISYFVYHIIKGDRGLLAWYKLNNEYENTQNNLLELKEDISILYNKVSKFRNDICPDLLEQQAKQVLGLAYPQEIVIIND